MLPLYIGIYVFILIFLWGFFFVARHHAYKYKNFSDNIPKVTETLFILLIGLSILGGILIFFLGDFDPQARINPEERPRNVNF
ncbi:hypothetical protein LAT59_04610 [Candidatus Gracilibacteria bacterium]|nr:hypothetical protein [Candidatus Gracilibacteria bacterium]